MDIFDMFADFFVCVLVFLFWSGKKVIFISNKIEGEKWQKVVKRSFLVFVWQETTEHM